MFIELKSICAATLDLYATFRFHFELWLKKLCGGQIGGKGGREMDVWRNGSDQLWVEWFCWIENTLFVSLQMDLTFAVNQIGSEL